MRFFNKNNLITIGLVGLLLAMLNLHQLFIDAS